MRKHVYGRGRGTVELPFLVSCTLFLLDRRYWILGLRSRVAGTRFDLVARYAAGFDHVVLVESKFRGDGRTVRPYEVKRFQEELEVVKQRSNLSRVYGVFMTNTSYSRKALELARKHRIRTYAHVPLLFRLTTDVESEGGRA